MGGKQSAAAVFRRAVFEGAVRDRRRAAAALTAEVERAALSQSGNAVFKIAVCHRDGLGLGVDATAVMLHGCGIIAVLSATADKAAVIDRHSGF